MRCKNCGWPNKPSETVCTKCGSPLVSEDDSDMSYNNRSGENLGKTVFEDDIFGSRDVPNNKTVVESEETSNNPCPKCGYPLRPGTEKCPNCKFQISGVAQSGYSPDVEEQKKVTSSRRPTRMDVGSGSHRGTVNPYMMNMDLEPSFVLKPIKRSNERHDFDDLEFEGKTVSLNRDNTEENNASITSREQAVITNVDGHWFIEDRSEQKTTFVQAAKRIELNDGDLILLGNRLFEFHE